MSAPAYDIWRGSVQRQVDEHERRLNSYNGTLDKLREEMNDRFDALDEKLDEATEHSFRTRALWALFGVLAGVLAALVAFALTQI